MPASDERGSAVVEVAWVGAILTVVTVSVLQLALALHVRNTVLDSAAEGARFAALADNSAVDGVVRCQNLITAAVGAIQYSSSFGNSGVTSPKL